MTSIRLSFTSICLLLCHLASAQRFDVHPQNDVDRDLTLYAFVNDLKFITATKNKKALMAYIDSNVRCSFSGERGLADFRRMWMIDAPESPIWSNLTRLLRAGGTFDMTAQSVCFPNVFTASIPDSIDLAEIFFVTGAQVSLRQRPDTLSPVLARLSDELVYRRTDTTHIPPCRNKDHAHYYQVGEKQDWVPVSSFDKTIKGYVYWDYLWSPFDYRLFASRRSGHWRITSLIAGQ